VEIATDIAQETFLIIWEKQIDTNSKNIKGLLLKIAGDLFVSSYRRQKTLNNFKLRLKPLIESQSPEDSMQFKELVNKYDIALTKLPEKQRVVFLMSRIDNMKYHEIATAVGISVKAVEKRMKHALLYLKKELDY